MRARWSRDDRLRVLVEKEPGFGPAEWEASLDEGFPQWRDEVEVAFSGDRRSRKTLVRDAEVFVASWVSQKVLDGGKSLRWVHVTLSGQDFGDDLEVPEDVTITAAAGVASGGIAEHVAGLMIALDRRFDRALERQSRWDWSQDGILGEIRGLRGRTVGIAGLGHSGRAVARVAAALGMRAVALTRTGQPAEGVAHVFTPDALDRFLRVSDFAVLCVPLTRETRGMIGEAELAALGAESFLVNVARGELVDEAALAQALKDGTIAGAALDVLSQEPPPRRHPLRGCPNLIVTPHVAGNVHTFAPEIRAQFVAELRRVTERGFDV